MDESSEKIKTYQLNNPMESYPGLSINDLNRYLPAVQTVDDIIMDEGKVREGLFHTTCLDGLRAIPDESIELIIASPPINNWDENLDFDTKKTLQGYYEWNRRWIGESCRVLKKTGAIYIISPWEYSGMYQGLLSNLFILQTRITWKDGNAKNNSDTWKNEISDIWFATKTDEFLFKNHPVGIKTIDTKKTVEIDSNFWGNISDDSDSEGYYPQALISKILEASSFKLNWVLDPFLSFGDVGIACKSHGRRFIGFETNKDHLLISMKRIDRS
mgnify:CR=1 FL=1